MRATAAAALMSLVLLQPESAAQQRPDFSGRWVPASPLHSEQEIRITTSKGTLKVTNALDGAGETVTYNLDGTPRREPAPPTEERWSTAAWRGSTLVLTNTRLTKTAEMRTEHTLSFDTTHRLILGTTRLELDANRDPSTPPVPKRKTVIVLNKRR